MHRTGSTSATGHRSRRHGERIGRFIVAGALLALCAGVARAQLEGRLDNDSYLPVDAAAEQALALGDQAFSRAQADPAGSSSPGPWTAACEAWRNALVRSRSGSSSIPRPVTKPGELSPWSSSEGDVERYTEGIEEAVFRRMSALPQAGRTSWRERFESLAEQELDRADLGVAELARVERELPGTSGAARAALLLAEFAFERGEKAAARAWLQRARRHISFAGPGDGKVPAGIARRETMLPRPAAPISEEWNDAANLVLLAAHDLELPRAQAQRSRPLGAGPQAGMGHLEDGRTLLQTPAALWLLGGPKHELAGPFDNNEWLGSAELSVEPSVAPGNAPGWRLDPATDKNSSVVVAGRTLGGQANVLARLDFELEPGPPRLRWALRAAAGPGLSAGEGQDEFEFEPGPLWTEGLVIVLVRRSGAASGEHELELRALDPESGAVRWSSYLGKGGQRVSDAGRFARRAITSMPAEPLLATSQGIFAGGQLGFGAMVAPLDGRLRFTVRNRRRDPAERGWTGWGSVLDEQGQLIAWAPADTDHLYRVNAAGPDAGGSPWLGAPDPLGGAEALVTADRNRAVVLSRSGARWALAQWDLDSGARRDGLRLGPEEEFAGRALASSRRVLAASTRALYLFDRDADLALLSSVSLGGPLPRGGNVWAEGSRVFVLSTRRVEIFSAR